MNGRAEKILSEYCHRFGLIAVDQGYVTSDQFKEAMVEQIDDGLNNRPHRIIGRILLDRGWMTYQQIESVMNELFRLSDEYVAGGLQEVPPAGLRANCRG